MAWFAGIVSFAIAAVIVWPAMAGASCFDCQSNYDYCIAADVDGAGKYGCLVVRDSCLSSCERPNDSGRSSSQQVWGAVVRAESGTLGVSSGFADEQSAVDAASRDCRAKENAMVDCKVATTFHDACGGVATAPDGSWGADWGNSASEAGDKALRNCTGYGGQGCVVVGTICTGR